MQRFSCSAVSVETVDISDTDVCCTIANECNPMEYIAYVLRSIGFECL
jgi:hypothetical protein